MSIRTNIKLIYPSVPDNVVDLLISNAYDYIADYCNFEEGYQPQGMDSLLFKMVQEDVNKLQAEGLQSESAGGNSITYQTDYSQEILRRLNKHKRIQTV